jgi:hypothetical protein
MKVRSTWLLVPLALWPFPPLGRHTEQVEYATGSLSHSSHALTRTACHLAW